MFGELARAVDGWRGGNISLSSTEMRKRGKRCVECGEGGGGEYRSLISAGELLVSP